MFDSHALPPPCVQTARRTICRAESKVIPEHISGEVLHFVTNPEGNAKLAGDRISEIARGRQHGNAAPVLSVIDGALSLRMLYGDSKVVPILSPAEAVLKAFQKTRARHCQ